MHNARFKITGELESLVCNISPRSYFNLLQIVEAISGGSDARAVKPMPEVCSILPGRKSLIGVAQFANSTLRHNVTLEDVLDVTELVCFLRTTLSLG